MTEPHIARQMTPHGATARVITTDRGDFAALDTGAASPSRGTVLLVPGYTGSKEDFAPLLDLLAAEGYRAVAIDQRGQYESVGTDDPSAYSVEQLGADLLSIAAELDAPVHVVGHSFGGLVVRGAVLADPSAFATVTLMSSGPSELPTGARRSIIEASEPHLHSMGLAGIYDAGQHSLAKDPTWAPPAEPLRTFLRDRFVNGSAHALRHMGRTMLTEPDRVAELKATGVPALVLYGRHDNAWTPESQSDMALRLGAREMIIEGAMHSPAVENPNDTARALLDFWSTHPQ